MGRGGLCACSTDARQNRRPRVKWLGEGSARVSWSRYSGDVTIDLCPIEDPLRAQPETGTWVQVFYLGGDPGGRGERERGVYSGRKEANKKVC